MLAAHEELYDKENVDKLSRLTPKQLLPLISWKQGKDGKFKFNTEKQKLDECRKILKYLNEIKRAKYKRMVNYSPNKDNPEGRFYANTKSLQNVGGSVRDFIIDKRAKDYDMKNAHPTFLKYICETRFPDQAISHLRDYILNRQTILDNFKINKFDVLKTINCDRCATKNNFLKELHRELKPIKQALWDDPDLQHLHPTDPNHKNKKSSLLNKLMCIEERKALDAAATAAPELFVNMFDGFQSLEPCDLNKLNQLTAKWGVEWDTKERSPLEFVEPEESDETANPKPYELVKEEFERKCFLLEDPTCYCEESKRDGDDCLILRKQCDFKIVFGRLWYFEEKVDKDGNVNLEKTNFLRTWFQDEDLRSYKKMDFLPPPCHCEEGTYNTFKGFNFEKNKWAETMDGNADYSLLTNHIRLLSGDDQTEAVYNYILDWLAHIIQRPGELSRVALLFVSKQGVGKNLLFDAFFKIVLGNPVYLVSENADDFVGKWVRCANKVCCVWNETNAKDTFSAVEKVKALITEPSLRVEPKGIQPYEVKNFSRFLFFSNRDTPVQIDPFDRRFQAIRCGEKQSSQYYSKLHSALQDHDVLWSFTKMLLERNVKNKNFETSRIKTTFWEALSSGNTNTLDKFLTWCFYEDIIRANPEVIKKVIYFKFDATPNEISSPEFFQLYKTFCEKNTFKNMGRTKFNESLSSGFKREIQKKKICGKWKIIIDPIKLLDSLLVRKAIDEEEREELGVREAEDICFNEE